MFSGPGDSTGWEPGLSVAITSHGILSGPVSSVTPPTGSVSSGLHPAEAATDFIQQVWALALPTPSVWGHGKEGLSFCILIPLEVEVLVAQLCPTLCNPMDCSPPGSSVHGILQARTVEWVAMPSSRGSSWPRDQRVSLTQGPRVPCIAGRFFAIWATREASLFPY